MSRSRPHRPRSMCSGAMTPRGGRNTLTAAGSRSGVSLNSEHRGSVPTNNSYRGIFIVGSTAFRHRQWRSHVSSILCSGAVIALLAAAASRRNHRPGSQRTFHRRRSPRRWRNLQGRPACSSFTFRSSCAARPPRAHRLVSRPTTRSRDYWREPGFGSSFSTSAACAFSPRSPRTGASAATRRPPGHRVTHHHRGDRGIGRTAR